ncbi:hypothetical protein [Nannocystis radixulma]|uniref:Uncharacterized protein n=1 Tax=Nannocystis radixulma TaxID=2995305 RepID=A0ABT5BLN1_9BACT|nr:hypothetical protein [Nannocystis radixulma]MDC0675073.1 hypothetical protein [Nannocystis radixulma]
MSIARSLVLLACLAACGPEVPMETASTGPGTSTTDPGTTTAPGTSTTTTSPSPTTTTGDPTTVDPSTVTTEPGNFITPPDGGGGCIAPFGEYEVRCYQCDPWAQQCFADQKCVPARDIDDGPWTDSFCVPLDAEPAGPGEPCTIESSPTSFIDTCDLHSICFGVDPDTLAPVCVPLCSGSPDAPECPDGSACVIADNLIPCLPTCDPLASTCPMGQVCSPDSFFVPTNFVCFTADVGALKQQFEPCDGPSTCAAGLACADAGLAVECDPQQSATCCLPYCDLDQPTCPGVMQQCQPFFPDPPPPELAHVGLCRLP